MGKFVFANVGVIKYSPINDFMNHNELVLQVSNISLSIKIRKSHSRYRYTSYIKPKIINDMKA